ncbi:MAG: hypothetical protein IJX81_05420 [Clostridia bacterium]|nr:hypothetical protein [Clostridia bacterium]
MKKKSLAAISAVLLATTLFASCTSASQKLSFSPNWAQNTLGNTGAITGEEVLEYEVNFTDATGFNEEYYSVLYCPEKSGKYVTTLKNNSSGDGYIYTTRLELDVQFAIGSAVEVFTDVVETEMEFKSTLNALQPVRSEKTVLSHTPRNVDATTFEAAYVDYDYTVLTEYDGECNAAVVTYTDRKGTLLSGKDLPRTSTKTFEIDKEKYTYLDNEQLLFAVRGLSSTYLSSQRIVNIYDAYTSALQEVKLNAESKDSEKFSFSINGTPLAADTVVEYTPVKLSLNATNAGAAITAWYATTTDPSNNVYRNAMLYMETAVSYNIGSLRYSLKNAQFAN